MTIQQASNVMRLMPLKNPVTSMANEMKPEKPSRERGKVQPRPFHSGTVISPGFGQEFFGRIFATRMTRAFQQQAMREHGTRQAFDIVGDDEISAVVRAKCLGGTV